MAVKTLDEADPVDVYVGSRVRDRRIEIGMSQEALGAAAGVSFQQVQKYEKGGNRISASRLVQFAKALEVPPSYFFPDTGVSMPNVDPRDRKARELYELHRRRVGRLPAYEDLDTSNAFDAALLATALELADIELGKPRRQRAA